MTEPAFAPEPEVEPEVEEPDPFAEIMEPGGAVEDRGVLGSGPRPTAADLLRAVTLAHRVGVVALVLAAGARQVLSARR